MPFNLTVPGPAGDPLTLTLNVGETIFALGANGTGKSALMHRLYQANHANARRISAHRQTWFASSAINISPQQRRQIEKSIHSNDQNQQARWIDHHSGERANIALYDLIDAENVRARAIANAVDDDDLARAAELSKKDAPIKVINELLRLSNLPLKISIHENEELFASKSGSAPYSVAELSDGERSAILIAANVLNVKEGTLILIDEPERHLHRSIISPLLTLLFRRRPDCAFIVSTHEVMLPIDNPTARVLLIRACTCSGSSFTSWDVDLIPAGAAIDENLMRDVLGARRKVLFVEGTESSIDKPLYSLVFPEVTMIPRGTCREVEHSVLSIRAAEALHRIGAFGIVDNDGRTSEEVSELRTKGIYALPVFSVESIYYHPEIQGRVAERHAAVIGGEAPIRLASAKDAAIAAINPHIERLSRRAVEKVLREEVFRRLPRNEDIANATPIEILIDSAAVIASERSRLQDAVSAGDLLTIFARYPVRETSALGTIAQNLGFQDRDQYEGAVRRLLMDDNQALTFVKSLFGNLPTDIDAT